MVGFIKTFDQYPGKLDVGHFLALQLQLQEDLNVNLKFRSRFNRGFINHGCLESAIQK